MPNYTLQTFNRDQAGSAQSADLPDDQSAIACGLRGIQELKQIAPLPYTDWRMDISEAARQVARIMFRDAD